MKILPLVSVIIPTYNRKEYVARAIDSALRQTYENTEILVIDDGSADGTLEVIATLGKKDSRIAIVKNQVNLGFVKTLNKAIGMSRGDYIARLDDDDAWCDPEKLEKQIGFMEKNPEYVLAGGGVIKVDSKGKEVVRFSLPNNDEDIKKAILISNVFAHSAVVFKRVDFKRVGGYDEEFGFFADWDLWLKIGRLGKCYNFQESFIYYSDQEQRGIYTTHDYKIRRKLMVNIKLRNKYKNYYPGYKKAILVCWANYLYSFLPFRKKMWPMLFWLRNAMLGPSPYTYLNIKDKENNHEHH